MNTNIKRKRIDEKISLVNLKKIKLDVESEYINYKSEYVFDYKRKLLQVDEININKKIKLEEYSNIKNTKRKRSQIDENVLDNLKKIKLEESILPYSIDILMYSNFNNNHNYMMSYIK